MMLLRYAATKYHIALCKIEDDHEAYIAAVTFVHARDAQVFYPYFR